MKRIAIAAAVLLAGFAAGYAETPEAATAVVAPPTVLAEDKGSVVQANNAFAFNLYANLRGQTGNLFFSPVSISTGLSMAWCGARGETAGQMASVLGYRADRPITPEWIAKAYGEHLVQLLSKPKGYELLAANALWGQKGYAWRPDFLSLLKIHYGSGLGAVDFTTNTEITRKTINDWVEKETREKIKGLIPPGVLDPMTRLVLTNAIYFKGDWVFVFKKSETKDRDFFAEGGQMVKAPMMNQWEHFGYMDGDEFQALEMPYKGGALSMVILLPKKKDGLAALEKTLSAEKVAEWLAKLARQKVHVTVPKFKTTAQFMLADTLKRMGMTDAFDGDKADFSGMDGKRDIFISHVIHKAFVDVNEEGTEAASATAIVGTFADGPPSFYADHPFIFLIRDKASGCILFLGRVANPKE